ncbi:hypothetical protein BOTNAR_0127g00190 [Botryotinia narcissicola]|uniref:Uncharacterized protein n=1 Tax=Botryotinia narcissicola TaxID=278944 RepID=A0A4Z1IPZ8_9HELO|nr:hypothetical protein BOTNAR_0127g00190 [Botryotinia narcissicola]
MDTAVSDFYPLCRQMGHPLPTFIKLNNQPKNRVALVVTVYGQQIVSSRPESTYKAAKTALARKATHYLSGSQTTMPQMAFDAGNAIFGNNGQSISNASALQHQAANLAVSESQYQFSRITDRLMAKQPVSRNAPSTDDQLCLEKHFRRQIISQLGSATGVQVTAAADRMADIILRRHEGQTTGWHEAMRAFTERLTQRLNESSG